MSKSNIPVHRMDDWFSGVYIKPFGAGKPVNHTYEISQPHRHDFYYCILLAEGQMEMEVDFKAIQLSGGTLFFSYPGQIHRILSNQMERGWFLAFDPAHLDEKLKTLLDQRLSEVIVIPLTTENLTGLHTFISNLYTLYNDQTQLFRLPIIQSMVTALGYQVASAYLSMEQSGLTGHSDRSVTITKSFKQLLRGHFKTMKKPAEYAAKMNLSAGHLNDSVRAVTGFSVTWFIQQELVRAAQRELYYSDLSIKEIAGRLGFDDPKYFSRIFTKLTSMSPVGFKKNSR